MSTLFASILNLSVMLGDDFSRRHFQMQFFLGALRVKKELMLKNCIFRVPTVREKSGKNEKKKKSRSGKSQGILSSVMEI